MQSDTSSHAVLGKSVQNEPLKKIYMFFFDYWTVCSTLIQFIHEIAPRSLWFVVYWILWEIVGHKLRYIEEQKHRKRRGLISSGVVNTTHNFQNVEEHYSRLNESLSRKRFLCSGLLTWWDDGRIAEKSPGSSDKAVESYRAISYTVF